MELQKKLQIAGWVWLFLSVALGAGILAYSHFFNHDVPTIPQFIVLLLCEFVWLGLWCWRLIVLKHLTWV